METELKYHVPEKELPLTTTPALEKDPSLTKTIPPEKDLFVTTTPTSDKDPSFTINQASEKDPSLTINQEKDPYLTITPISNKDPSLKTHASEKVPFFTTEASEKDSFLTTQASEKESFLTSTNASENDSTFTSQTSKNDLSLTTNQASEKDSSSSTTHASEKDPSSKTTQASDDDHLSLKKNEALEKDPSFTATHASQKDPASTTQESEKDPSSRTTQASEKGLYLITQALEKDSSSTPQVLEKDISSTTTQASEKFPSSTETQASQKLSSSTESQAASEKDPTSITQALEKDSSSTPQASDEDISSTTTQASEKDPSSITQALENDSSSTPQASEKAISSTTTQASEKIPSSTTTQASEKLSISTESQEVAEKDPSSRTTQTPEKDPSSRTTQASEKDPYQITTQASKKDPSLTTQALEKDPSSTAQTSEKDISLTKTQVSEKVPSSTETQASEKISSSTESQASENNPSLTAQVSEEDPSLITERVSEKPKFGIKRMPSDMSSSSRPPSGPAHRRSKSDIPSGNGNKRAVGFQKLKSQVQRALKWGKVESKNYNFNPEILADQKRQWYQLHPDSLELTYEEPTSLFEHFIIAGLHPNSNLEVVETAYARLKKWELHNGNKEASDPKTRQRLEPPSLEPEILFEYPPGKRLSMSPKDLAAFCFPESVKARVLERTPSLSELNEIVFGQEHLSTDDLSFVFSLKVSDNATLYGVCLLVKEIVQRPPTARTMLGDPRPQSPSYEGSSRVLTSAPRCYCVLTRAPFFELHYEMIKSIITQERLTRITQFVNYLSLHDHALVSRSNDQKKENDDAPKEECSTDWMATAIPIDSAVALTAAAAGIISDGEMFSSSSKGEHRSSESTSTETSEHSHVREIVNEGGKNLQSLDDYTSEASETLRDGLDVEHKLEDVACANPRIHAMDPPPNSESLISSVSSMDEDEKLSCSNDNISKEDWIVEWAKENNNYLLQIVCSYYSLPFPERGEEISFKPLEHLQTVEYQRPSVSSLTQTEKHLNLIRWDTLSALEGNKKLAAAEEAATLSIWTTAAICRALSLENILTLLTGILLEKQVLFVYPNLGVLSAIVLSIIPIIRPFQWQSLFLPILPGKMKDFLDAPVPFIVGMQHMPNDFKLKTSNLIHVDVEKDQVKSCKLPALPDYKDLISELGPIYFKMSKQQSVAKKRPVYQYDETEAEAAGRFLAVMKRYLYSLCTDMRSHTITSVRANDDRVSILLKDSFLDSFPSKDQPFIKLFLETQLFSVLSDSYISIYEN